LCQKCLQRERYTQEWSPKRKTKSTLKLLYLGATSHTSADSDFSQGWQQQVLRGQTYVSRKEGLVFVNSQVK
jgi:hypothetical protein